MNTHIRSNTEQDVPPEEIMRKLASCYELDTLDAIDMEADAYDDGRSRNSSTDALHPPMSPSQNLNAHPFFNDFSTPVEETIFPYDQMYRALMLARRIRPHPSPPGSPTPPPRELVPEPNTPSKARSGKAQAKAESAPDSDTSDLTQDSADEEGDEEGHAGDTTATAGNATDGGTDGEDMDVDEKDGDQDDEPDASSVPPPRKRGRKRGGPPNNPRGRGAGRGKPAVGRKTKR